MENQIAHDANLCAKLLRFLKSHIFAVCACMQRTNFAYIFAPIAGLQMPRSHRLPMYCKVVALS